MDKKKGEKLLKEIRKIAKIAENKQCADCPERLPPYVNLTHWTFVCTNCSGIHREFAHKLKSISLSTFSEDDVRGLKQGGNEACRKIYLANWDQADFPAPKSGDNPRIREWIRKKYVEKRWHQENATYSGSNPSRVGKGGTSLSSRRLSSTDNGKQMESKEKSQMKRKSFQQTTLNNDKKEINERTKESTFPIAPPKKNSAVSEPVDLLDFTGSTSPTTTVATTNSTNGQRDGNVNSKDVFGDDPFSKSDPFDADPFAGTGTGANFSGHEASFDPFGTSTQLNTFSDQVPSNINVFPNTFPTPPQQQHQAVNTSNIQNPSFLGAPNLVAGINANQVGATINNNNISNYNSENQMVFPSNMNPVTNKNPPPNSTNPSPFMFPIRPQQEPVENKTEPIKTVSIEEAFSGLEIQERERRLSISASGGDPSISPTIYTVGETCIYTNSQGQSWYARVETVTNDTYTPYLVRLTTGQTKETDQHHLQKMPQRRPSQGQAVQYTQHPGQQYPGSHGGNMQQQPNGSVQDVVQMNKPVDAFADLNPSQLSSMTAKSNNSSNNIVNDNNPFAAFGSSPSSVTQPTVQSNVQPYNNSVPNQEYQQNSNMGQYNQFGQPSFPNLNDMNSMYHMPNTQQQQQPQQYAQTPIQGTGDVNPFLSIGSNGPPGNQNQSSTNPFDMF